MRSQPPEGPPRRPEHASPRSVASPEQRQRWPQADVSLARRAVEWGLDRTRASLRRHDLAVALLFDPVNVRYTSGTSVMPVWTLHSVDRYLLVPADGEPVLWEYASAPPELTSPYPRMETRTATSWSVFGSGASATEKASRFARDVAQVVAGGEFTTGVSGSTGWIPMAFWLCRRQA